MSKPSNGYYYIVSKATTSDGKQLAINYNGEGTTVTVTEYEQLPTQVWGVNDNNSKIQFVSPQDAMSLMITPQSGNRLSLTSSGKPSWAIRGSNGVYTVQDGGFTYFWMLQEVESGAPVYRGAGTGALGEYWEFIPA